MKHGLSILVFWLCAMVMAWGQEEGEAATTEVNNLPPSKGFVELTFDYGKLLALGFDDVMLEGGLRGGLPWLALAADVGSATITPQEQVQNAENYEVSGTYYRVGVDLAVLQTDKGANLTWLGFRYGSASFADQGQVVFASSLWPDQVLNIDRNDLSGSWWEVVLSTDGPLIKGSGLRIGAALRIRGVIDSNLREEDPLRATHIPGYGRSDRQMVPALNLWLRYKLEFR